MFGSGLGCLEEESIFASQGSVASQVGLSQTLQLAPAAADLDPEHKGVTVKGELTEQEKQALPR